jgi:hypothetical protein
MALISTRAKWRSSLSGRSRVGKKHLTQPALSERPGFNSSEVESFVRLEQPMIKTESMGPFLGLCYAAVFGTFVTIGIHDYLPDLSPPVFVLMSGAGFIAFYFAGLWIHFRSEQNKKLPTNSKELRRRTKRFYDWLDSQGRPQSRR